MIYNLRKGIMSMDHSYEFQFRRHLDLASNCNVSADSEIWVKYF